MSAPDKSKKSDDAKDAPKGGKSKKLLIIVIAAVVLLGGGGAAAWFFLKKPAAEGHAKAEEKHELPKPASYFAMDPAFVVNLNGGEDGPRYLQIEVQLMTRDPEELKHIEENAPAIRAHLLMLFSQVKATDIADIAGRQKLQAAALADAQKVMTGETGKKCIEELLFTSFVTQ